MRGSVDRIEENIAVIVYDNGRTENILNDNNIYKEGDRIVKTSGKIKVISDSMKKEIIDLQNKIFGK